MGLSSGCVDGDGARYWGLVCWLTGVSEEIKSPCTRRGFVGLGYDGIKIRIEKERVCTRTTRRPPRLLAPLLKLLPEPS